MRVIINADDLGKEQIVNDSIEREIQKSNITSTTIMANADAFDGAVAIAKKYTWISYGIHLTLDEYRPVTDNPLFVKYGIVDSKGVFVNKAIFNTRITNELLEAIEAEWDAQIEKLEANGIHLSHIDSHHHVHTIPSLRNALVNVMKKHHIKRVRNCDYIDLERARHGYKHFLGNNVIKEWLYLLLRFSRFKKSAKWNEEMNKVAKLADIFCSTKSYFNNIQYFYNYAKDKTIELECHPGHPRYNDETALLSNITGVEKITYKEL